MYKYFLFVCTFAFFMTVEMIMLNVIQKQQIEIQILKNEQGTKFYKEKIELYKCQYYQKRLEAEDARLQAYINSLTSGR